MLVGIIITAKDRFGVYYSKPTLSGRFHLDTGNIYLDFDIHNEEDELHLEMLMPSGTVVPIEFDPTNQAFRVKGDDDVDH